MKKLFLFLVLLALTAPALATDVTIGPSVVPGFYAANLPPDVTVAPVSVVNGNPVVTCSNCFRSQWVGLGGFRITINTVPYTVAYVSSRSSLTLTTNYAAGDSSAATILWYKYVELRIYADSSFQPAGKTYVVQPGAPGSGAWHRRVAASVVNELGINNLYIPQLTLDATTDSLTNQAARYTAAFYRPEGSLIQFYDCFESFLLQPSGATTWPDICMFNTRQVIVQDDSTYTKTQIDAMRTGCTTGQGLFYAATGLKPDCLNIGTGLQIIGNTISATAGSSYQTILNNGTPLTQRTALNFLAPSFIASDNGGALRTDVTADADLNALASLTGTGFAQRTGVDTWALNTNVVEGPASATDNAIARFDLTTGKIIQNSAVTVADTSGNFSVPNDWTVSNAGSSVQLTSVSQEFATPTRSTVGRNFGFTAGAQTQSSGVIVGNRTQTTYNQAGTAGSNDFETVRVETALGSGTHNFIQGFGGAAGATSRFRINNLGNYFFGASGGFIGDENGNEYLKFSTAASAINEITIANAATGARPVISSTGDNTDVGLGLSAKGAADIASFSNFIITRDAATFSVNNTTSAKTLAIAVQNDSNTVFYRQGGNPTAAIDMNTGVWTFNLIPILPASDPTTNDQATRKIYVDNKQVSFSASFTIADPSTATLSSLDFGTIIIPGGGEYTITKCKLARVSGTHTAGGSVSFIIQQQGVGTKCTVTFNDTNSGVNTVYTDDVGDFTVAENVILGAAVSARSGTITERNVSITVEGFRKVF